MICKICGGKIEFENGIGVCSNCSSKIELNQPYNPCDVVLLCIEADEEGRRTKDSVIAQNIYDLLSNKGVSVYFERITASNLIEDELEVANYFGIYRAKVVVIIGTNKSNFESIISESGRNFQDKTIIPVFSNMEAVDLPDSLIKYQATNYDSISGKTDLVNSIAEILGIEKSVDLEKAYKKTNKKKRAIIATAIVLILSTILGAAYYVVFCTPMVLDSKKYEYAQQLLNDGSKIEALEAFKEIEDYQDSSNVIINIYNTYDGYYCSKDEKTSLYIDFQQGKTLLVEIASRNSIGKLTKIEENVKIEGNTIKFEFIDSNNNKGTAAIELNNKGLNLSVSTLGDKTNNSIGNIKESFLTENKKDKPLELTVTGDQLKEWLNSKITISDIKDMGYELVFDRYVSKSGSKDSVSYKIKNSNVYLWFLKYDMTKFGFLDETYNHYKNESKESMYKDFTLVAVNAPVKMVMKEYIGNVFLPIFDNDYIYAPESDFDFCIDEFEECIGFYNHYEGVIDEGKTNQKSEKDLLKMLPNTIEGNMQVCITNKSVCGEYKYNRIKKYLLEHYSVQRFYKEKIVSIKEESWFYVEYITDSDDAYLFYDEEYFSDKFGNIFYDVLTPVFYRLDKKTGEVKRLNEYDLMEDSFYDENGNLIFENVIDKYREDTLTEFKTGLKKYKG